MVVSFCGILLAIVLFYLMSSSLFDNAVANYNTKIAENVFYLQPGRGLLCINKAETLRISGLYGKNLNCMLGGRKKLQTAVFNNCGGKGGWGL